MIKQLFILAGSAVLVGLVATEPASAQSLTSARQSVETAARIQYEATRTCYGAGLYELACELRRAENLARFAGLSGRSNGTSKGSARRRAPSDKIDYAAARRTCAAAGRCLPGGR